MLFLSQGLIGESSNRMACDLFSALDLREEGNNNRADMLEARIPNELTKRGINRYQVGEVVLNAASIVYYALYDLTDQRLGLFIEGKV